MSKRKDRLNTNYRYCTICGGKSILVWKTKKLFSKEKTYIRCYNKCQKDILVKDVYTKVSTDYLFTNKLLNRRTRWKI